MTESLYLLSGGAAQGLVRTLQSAFERSSGLALQPTFGAVGAMQQLLRDGAACDVLILTQALIAALQTQGLVLPATAHDLGRVKTGVAVKHGAAAPRVDDAAALRAALLAASALYFPDPQLATAGIHVMKVLHALELADTLAPRLRPYPNGNAAMRAMAACADQDVIGCTQVTEILITPGVTLVADLPPAFELATVYTAAICTRASHPEAARALIASLVSAEHAPLRAQAGFLPV